MRELPILFSTPMVQAILDGRKIMTRRTVKNIPEGTHRVEQIGESLFEAHWGIHGNSMFLDGATEIKCPYQPGDRLWVRETWAYIDRGFGGDAGGYVYRASENGQLWETETEGWRWRPSIHMPKEAARIWLEVTNVRVERLQEISQKDIEFEGIWHYSQEYREEICIWRDCAEAIRDIRTKYFKKLWDGINLKRGYGWDTNPWVWVVSFKKVTPCD